MPSRAARMAKAVARLPSMDWSMNGSRLGMESRLKASLGTGPSIGCFESTRIANVTGSECPSGRGRITNC
jgi:hypothetical protein